MNDDILKRLRSPAIVFYEYSADDGAIFSEAADRIEELEAALDVIASNNNLALSWTSTAPMPLERYRDNCYEMMNIARAALGEKRND